MDQNRDGSFIIPHRPDNLIREPSNETSHTHKKQEKQRNYLKEKGIPSPNFRIALQIEHLSKRRGGHIG
jgi:hypothetical protein